MKNNVSYSVWLIDLTHTGQTIASDAVPAAVGMIAEVLERECPELNGIQVFKFPDELNSALESGPPSVIGFSNYSWNYRLSQCFGSRIKDLHPNTITVMGGPNFPTVPSEQKAFLEDNPWLDFYIVKEGELAFSGLVSQLVACNFDLSATDLDTVPNLFWLNGSTLAHSKEVTRIMDLSTIPSPYLSGRLDRYLDGRLLPVIQTNRGCPFKMFILYRRSILLEQSSQKT